MTLTAQMGIVGFVMGDLFTTGIRPSIDQWLLDKSKEVRDYQNYWSASSAGYCMRRVIFERLGVPKVESEADARKQRVFTSGHLFHSWIQEITKEAGLSIAQELELQDEDLMIRGHIDDLVLVPGFVNVGLDTVVPEGDNFRPANLILYDYKTQNSRAFSYKRPDMSHYHKMQLGTYMYMLRNGSYNPKGTSVSGMDLTPKTPVGEARILKISKDDLRLSEEQLMWTPDLEKEVVGYWRTLNGYWKAKKIPKCTCADYEGGFLAQEKWNGYFYKGEPCSIEWYTHCKKTELIKEQSP